MVIKKIRILIKRYLLFNRPELYSFWISIHEKLVYKNSVKLDEDLYLELRKIRRIEYSINMAETFDYVYGIGAPILDSEKRAIAAISLSGTKSTINVKTIPILAKKVLETSLLISNEITKK